MIICNNHESQAIENEEKEATLRSIRPSGKGYFKLGSRQWICNGRDFKNGKICRVLIFNVSFTTTEELTNRDIKTLGYSNKAEYMAQPYNKNNPCPDRVRYDFMKLEKVERMLQGVPNIERSLINELWRN